MEIEADFHKTRNPITSYITSEPKIHKKFTMWELSSTIDLNKISKLSIYTQDNLPPPGV